MKVLEQHIEDLKKLCQTYHAVEFYAFGSIANGNFTDKSDLDFLVRFSEVNPIDYFDNYMDFKQALEKLFSRKVDLVEIQTIKNPILKNSIDRNKVILYGREDSKMAV